MCLDELYSDGCRSAFLAVALLTAVALFRFESHSSRDPEEIHKDSQ
jgi:hypothetical protein